MRDFNHTVGVLVKAYLNDTLQNSNCHACAVGNMVAESKGYKLTKNHRGEVRWITDTEPLWFDAMCCGEIDECHPRFLKAKKEGETTGYTYEELAKIEVAFENPGFCTPRYDTGDNILNGLLIVVDILAEIHGIDLQSKEEAKALFVRH